MSLPPVSFLPFDGSSVCLFCGASETADPSYTEAAYTFGTAANRAAAISKARIENSPK